MAELTAGSARRDTGHAYRWQGWVSWVLGVVAIVEAAAIAILAGVIVNLFPLKEIVPMVLVPGLEKDQVLRVEPVDPRVRGWNLLIEKMLIDYVEKRETIDLQTEGSRWDVVKRMSSDGVWGPFLQLVRKDNPNSPYVQAQKGGWTRKAYVQAASQLNPRQWQIEFELRDFRNGVEIAESRRTLVATITVAVREQEVSYEDRYLNPIGLTVVGYGLAEKAQ